MIDKPLYDNPLGGGQQGPLDLSKMNKNPYNSEFIGLGKDQTNLFGYKVPDYVIKEQEERMKNNPINVYNMKMPDELELILSDPQGSNQLGGLSFRQPGDMGRYVADNDPGGIAAGFSNLEDFLAAGNLPQPTEGVSQDVLGNPNLIVDPNAEAQKKANEEFLKTADEYQRGFRESEFYKPGGAMTADMAEFTYSSPTRGDITMKGSSSGIGQFGAYLDSIGKGDLLQRVGGSFSSDLLGTVNPNDPSQQLLDGTRSVQPIVTGPQEITTQQAPMDSYNRVGQQLTGPNQVGDLNSRLNKIEQGIMSLLRNRGQGFNTGYQPNYGFNMGFGYSFPPFGGMYG